MPRKEHRSLRGTAVELRIEPNTKGSEQTLAWWLLTGDWHPVWSQFAISLIHLRETQEQPDPKLQFMGATHEILVMAIDPGDPPTVWLPGHFDNSKYKTPGFLRPIDVVHQFIATDEEMIQLVEYCAQGCINGQLNPSTDDNREELREAWLASCVRTLAHMRGEEHAP